MRGFRKIIGIGLVFSLSILLFMGIYAQMVPHQNMETAKRGVLDLTNYDFHKLGVVTLNGDWEFYEGKLLEPADFQKGLLTDVAYLNVPERWNGKTKEGGMSRKGYGTYRLIVSVKDADEIYGLKLRSIRMSHRLYIDGKLAGESGLPATSKEANLPGNTPYSTFFHANIKDIEIILQVSNYEYLTGGIVNAIQFGLHADISKLNSLLIGSDLAIIMMLVMFGAYHLSLYILRSRDKTYLLSGLYLLSTAGVYALYGEKLFQRLLPEMPFEIVYKMLDVFEFLSSMLIILFFCSIHHQLISRKKMKLLIAPIILILAAIIVLPYSLYNEMRDIFFLYIGFVPIAILFRMIYLFFRSEKGTYERKELGLFIVAIIALLASLIDGVLYSESTISSDIWHKVGIIGFITLMNLLLAVRLTNAYEKTELLTHRLTVSNQLKDEFLMHTSHEIKTPLHGIMNITSSLLDDDEHNLSARQKQNLWLVKDTSVKLSMLMQDLIDVTRLKHGELRLLMTVVDVRAVTQIVFDVLQFELAGKTVQLDNQVPTDMWVQADENRLRQIMYNLVHNAMKHTEKGVIRVSASAVDDYIHITVEDTGTGIPLDKYPKVFVYFEQQEHVLPEDGYTGMGVGLYISRKLVERMGGDIRIDWSEVGQGTRMMFKLPTALDYIPVNQERSIADFYQQRDVNDTDSLDIMEAHAHTILIVDDEASNIYTLLNILKRQRYNVIAAFSAKEALVKMSEHPQIDLVILDVMMPGISGIELCRLLRAQHSILDLPILFATVKDTSQDIALGFSAGANDYVTKPFEAETLVARIQTLIAMKTSIQEAIRNELAFHQAQIKPHFLYNALSSVISFCYTDGEKAAYLLSKLSQFLRYILDMDRNDLFVSLHRELELIDAYVEIEKARYGERFEFICYVDESLKHLSIPSLSIQPFVENAIRHGLFEKDGYGTVTLTIQEGDRYLLVTVQDNGIGIPDDLLYQMASGERGSGGIAIMNIRKRLDNLPGASLTISSEMGRGTKVTMYLPLNGRDQDTIDERWEELV
ncbi:hybrid sensor histidine kinase/response regulator [Paenibacillus pectinilyticus]|uniref:hybrid sensor histidine kinase/response regulator n=1 Tax=Paenibacillus pectinilyticus TaxID=512399 RepID=UPI000A93DE68